MFTRLSISIEVIATVRKINCIKVVNWKKQSRVHYAHQAKLTLQSLRRATTVCTILEQPDTWALTHQWTIFLRHHLIPQADMLYVFNFQYLSTFYKRIPNNLSFFLCLEVAKGTESCCDSHQKEEGFVCWVSWNNNDNTIKFYCH